MKPHALNYQDHQTAVALPENFRRAGRVRVEHSSRAVGIVFFWLFTCGWQTAAHWVGWRGWYSWDDRRYWIVLGCEIVLLLIAAGFLLRWLRRMNQREQVVWRPQLGEDIVIRADGGTTDQYKVGYRSQIVGEEGAVLAVLCPVPEVGLTRELWIAPGVEPETIPSLLARVRTPLLEDLTTPSANA